MERGDFVLLSRSRAMANAPARCQGLTAKREMVDGTERSASGPKSCVFGFELLSFLRKRSAIQAGGLLLI